MEPFACVITGDPAIQHQVWGDSRTGSIFVLKVPSDHIVDLSDGEGIDVAGPGLQLSDIPSEAADIESILELETAGRLDWRSIRYYAKPVLVDKSLGPEPKKTVRVSAGQKGAFYTFIERHASPALLEAQRPMLVAHGFAASAKRSAAWSTLMRVAVVALLAFALIALFGSAILRAVR